MSSLPRSAPVFWHHDNRSLDDGATAGARSTEDEAERVVARTVDDTGPPERRIFSTFPHLSTSESILESTSVSTLALDWSKTEGYRQFDGEGKTTQKT